MEVVDNPELLPLMAQAGFVTFGIDWIGCGERDSLLAGNRTFEALLTDRGIKHEWVITPGYAHEWTLWRRYLRDVLPKLFID